MLSSFLLLREIFPVEIKIPTYNSRRSPHVLGTGKAYIRVEFNVLLQRSLEILLGVIRPSPAIKCPVPITSTRLYQCSSPSIPDSWEYIKLPQVDFPKSWLQRTQPSLWTAVSSTELQASVFLGYSKNGVQCLHPGTRNWPRGTCNRRFPSPACGLPALAVCPFMETTRHSPQQLCHQEGTAWLAEPAVYEWARPPPLGPLPACWVPWLCPRSYVWSLSRTSCNLLSRRSSLARFSFSSLLSGTSLRALS